MKAILEFDLEDMDDRSSHEMAIKGRDAYLAIWRIKESTDDVNVKDTVNAILYDLGIDLNALP